MDIDKIARAANALKQEDYSHLELYKAMRDIQGGLTEKDLSAPAFYDCSPCSTATVIRPMRPSRGSRRTGSAWQCRPVIRASS